MMRNALFCSITRVFSFSSLALLNEILDLLIDTSSFWQAIDVQLSFVALIQIQITIRSQLSVNKKEYIAFPIFCFYIQFLNNIKRGDDQPFVSVHDTIYLLWRYVEDDLLMPHCKQHESLYRQDQNKLLPLILQQTRRY